MPTTSPILSETPSFWPVVVDHLAQHPAGSAGWANRPCRRTESDRCRSAQKEQDPESAQFSSPPSSDGRCVSLHWLYSLGETSGTESSRAGKVSVQLARRQYQDDGPVAAYQIPDGKPLVPSLERKITPMATSTRRMSITRRTLTYSPPD